jgi:hypothetical protein
MRRPILLDKPPPPPPLPSVRWSRFLKSRYLPMGGLAAGGVAAVLGASVALAMLLAPDVAARAPASDASVAAANPSAVAAKPAAASLGVQYVGEVKQDVKQTGRPCEEQTWPYIAAHCLKPASGPRPVVAKVPVDRADIKISRAGQPPLAATPAVAETPVVQPEQKLVAVPEAPIPMPAARPVRDQAMRDAQPKRSRSAAAPRDIRPEAQAEARRAYASGGLPSDRNPSPAVRRIETEYDVPGPFGSTRRVMVIRQQPLHHQAAAFSDDR